jgi:hypothetical protein
MNRFRFALLAVALLVVGLVATASFASPLRHANRAATGLKIRWDIINVDFSTKTLSAGGQASALGNDGSKITITGSGTFGGKPSAVTGGGDWTTSDPSGKQTGNGTYKVTSLVYFVEAAGTPPLPNDKIGDLSKSHAGLALLRIAYSDGSQGVLTVSCHLANSPDSLFEGITATKGYVPYWNRVAPPAPPGNANRTNFHVGV